jgi:hypothetical protein
MKPANPLRIAVLLFAAMNASCSKSDAKTVTIDEGEVERVNGCHVNLDQIRFYEDGSPLGDFRFVCDVDESALKEKSWWGNKTPPLMNSLNVGGCMRLKDIFYCVEHIEPGKCATLKATYEAIDSEGTLIKRIK